MKQESKKRKGQVGSTLTQPFTPRQRLALIKNELLNLDLSTMSIDQFRQYLENLMEQMEHVRQQGSTEQELSRWAKRRNTLFPAYPKNKGDYFFVQRQDFIVQGILFVCAVLATLATIFSTVESLTNGNWKWPSILIPTTFGLWALYFASWSKPVATSISTAIGSLLIVVVGTNLLQTYLDRRAFPFILPYFILLELILRKKYRGIMYWGSFALFVVLGLMNQNVPHTDDWTIFAHLISLTISALLIFVPLEWMFIRLDELNYYRWLENQDLENLYQEILQMMTKLTVIVAELAAQKAAEADKANNLKSEFLASMSHELRTPLNSIIGYTDIILNNMWPPALNDDQVAKKRDELLNNVKTNGAKLLGLINDILDLAKIEAGQVEVHITTVSPRQLIEEVVVTGQGFIHKQKKDIYLKSVYAQDLPASVNTDQKRMQQVITNLVSNAVKFTEVGGVMVSVELSPKPEHYLIKVIDTGKGMPSEAKNYIFEKFRQVDGSDSREQQGTGLGLAITKHLVEMMGGTIDLETEIGKGTTFIIEFPFNPVLALQGNQTQLSNT